MFALIAEAIEIVETMLAEVHVDQSAFALRLRRDSLRASSGLPSRSAFRREGWWAWEDLNFRPHAYQARALTN
jgi:hypothetical protein